MWVKPVTFEAHITFCSTSAPVGCVRSCRVGFQKCWYKVYFHRPIPYSDYGITHMSPEEIKLKEDLYALYQRLGY